MTRALARSESLLNLIYLSVAKVVCDTYSTTQTPSTSQPPLLYSTVVIGLDVSLLSLNRRSTPPVAHTSTGGTNISRCPKLPRNSNDR